MNFVNNEARNLHRVSTGVERRRRQILAREASFEGTPDARAAVV